MNGFRHFCKAERVGFSIKDLKRPKDNLHKNHNSMNDTFATAFVSINAWKSLRYFVFLNTVVVFAER